ncbi:MAG: hypothetical protein MJ214_00810 [Bacilli bacterium]|nr:hypothetical protein [Bacilli bacterium]
MNKNIKLISTLAFFSLALVSCNSNGGRLSRVSYEKSVGKCAEIAPTIKAFKDKQLDIVESELEETCPQGYFKLFSSGTVKTNINFKVTGGFEFASGGSRSIDIPDINFDLSDTITISWNEDEDYIKISDNVSHAYIKSEGTGEDKKYFKYFESPILGKVKICLNPTHEEEPYLLSMNEDGDVIELGLSFKNLVMMEVAYNNGYFAEKLYGNDNSGRAVIDTGFDGIGLDLSGFLEDNFLSPGNILENSNVITTIDGITEPSFEHNYSQKTDGSAAALNLKFNQYDASKLKELIPEGTDTTLEGFGTITADYFVAFENDFIRQHEIILNTKDLNLFLVTYSHESELANKTVVDDVITVRNLNANIQVSQDVIKGQCSVDNFDPAEYLPLNY